MYVLTNEAKLGLKKRAIAKMKPKGAPGPDALPPSFFKALGEKELEVLLHIYNTSFEAGFCPQIWRNATIIPLLDRVPLQLLRHH